MSTSGSGSQSKPPESGRTARSWPVWTLVAVVFVGGIGGGLALRGRGPSPDDSPAPPQKGSGGERPSSAAPSSNENRKADAKALQESERRFADFFRRGYQEFQAERYSEALKDFRSAVQAAPHLAEGHYYLGESYSKLFLSSQAEEAYREALARMSDFRPAAERLAVLLYERGAYREAIKLIKAHRTAKAKDPFFTGELAINYLALEEPENALPLLKSYTAERPREAWGWAQLGRAYEQSDDAVTAERLYRKAIKLDAHFALAQYWLGLLLAKTDRQAEAKPLLAEYDRLRKLENQEHEYSVALLRNAANPGQLARLAETRFELGKTQAAWQALERAERLAPSDPQIKALRRRWAGASKQSQ